MHNGFMIRKHIVVRGRVQGSGFRYYTQTEAMRLGLSGYVRDMPDNSIEIEAEGAEDSLAELLEWLETGPTWAEVESVDSSDRPTTGRLGFHIL